MSEQKIETKSENLEEELFNENLDNGSVLQKYKMAAQIANETMALLLKEIAVGKKVIDICEFGDKTIMEKVKPCFKKTKKMEKGIAFPTCINVNEIVCHFSPLSDEQLTLKDGDSVRIDIGVHLDGFISLLGHTVILTNSTIDGKRADALACAQTCIDVAGKMLIDGTTNTKISETFAKISKSFGVNLCEGVLSHQMKRFVIDGSKVILLKTTTEHTTSEITINDYEVYTVDVAVSTGSGKLRETTQKTTIFKRNPESNYHLKLKSSHQALKEIREKFNTLPFSIRHIDQTTGRLGMAELQKHQVVEGYPVLNEVKGEFVAHVKATFLVLKNETIKSTGFTLQSFKSDKSFDDKEVLDLVTESKKRKTEEKKKDSKKQKVEEKMDVSK